MHGFPFLLTELLKPYIFVFVLDGAGTDRCWETEKYLARDFSKHDIAPQKHCDEEMHKNEERQKREINFQEELRKIMEAEKVSYFWLFFLSST